MIDSRILIAVAAGVVLLVIIAMAMHKNKSSMSEMAEMPKPSVIDQVAHTAKTKLAEVRGMF